MLRASVALSFHRIPSGYFWEDFNHRECAKLLERCGEPDGIRTRDPLIKSQVLYRLSYGLSRGRPYGCVAAKVNINAKAGVLPEGAAQITASRKPDAFSKLRPSLGTGQGGTAPWQANRRRVAEALLAAPPLPHPHDRGPVGAVLQPARAGARRYSLLLLVSARLDPHRRHDRARWSTCSRRASPMHSSGAEPAST